MAAKKAAAKKMASEYGKMDKKKEMGAAAKKAFKEMIMKKKK